MLVRPQPLVLAFISQPHQLARLQQLKLHVEVVHLLAIVVALLTPAALTVHSLAVGAVLEQWPLHSAALPSTVVVTLLTPAALTVHSLALGAARERVPGSAFSADGRQPLRLLVAGFDGCCF